MKISKKWLILCTSLIVVIILLTGILVVKNRSEKTEDPGYANEISVEQVKKHASADSCWIIASSKVYDVTPNIVSKPTDNKFIAYCGGQFPVPGEPNKESSDLQKQLNNYYIGILVP